MSSPAFRAQGTRDIGIDSTPTPGKPAGIADADVLLAYIADKGATADPTPPSGWTLVASIASGGASTDVRLTVWYHRVASAVGEPASYAFTASHSDVSLARVAAYSGCIGAGNPVDAVATRANSSGTHGTAGLTTLGADRLLIEAVAFGGNSSPLGTWSATSPSSLTERDDSSSTLGSDVGYGYSDAAKAAAGATGASSVIPTNDFVNVGVLLALIPPVTIGQASESDTARPIAVRPAVRRASEADSAQAIIPVTGEAAGRMLSMIL